MRPFVGLLIVSALTACGTSEPDTAPNATVDLRNLADTDESGVRPARMAVQGDLIPTPSDDASRYHLLRTRTSVAGPVVSIVRQERGDRVVYARVQTDCGARQLLIVGVGNTRSEVETDVATNGPMRSIEGLPLRQELATFICDRVGTPLAQG